MKTKIKSLFKPLLLISLLWLSCNWLSFWYDNNNISNSEIILNNNIIMNVLWKFKWIVVNNKVYWIDDLENRYKQIKEDILREDLLSKKNIIYLIKQIHKNWQEKIKQEYINTLKDFIKQQNKVWNDLNKLISLLKDKSYYNTNIYRIPKDISSFEKELNKYKTLKNKLLWYRLLIINSDWINKLLGLISKNKESNYLYWSLSDLWKNSYAIISSFKNDKYNYRWINTFVTNRNHLLNAILKNNVRRNNTSILESLIKDIFSFNDYHVTNTKMIILVVFENKNSYRLFY